MKIWVIKFIIFLIFPLVLSSTLYAKHDKHKVEGEIIFSEKGKIYIYLVTEKIFQTPFTGIQSMVIELKEEDIATVKKFGDDYLE